MAEYPEVGMRLHAMYKGDGNYSPATVASLALDAWVSVNLLKSKALPKKPEKPPKAAVKKKLAPKAKANSAKPKPMDCSRAKKGMRVQDGKYWAAPIKVTFMGYDKQYDEWLGADRLHSKAIVPCKEKDAKDLGATKTAANSIKAAPDKTIKDLGASLLATAASAVPEPGVAPAVEVPGVTMQEELVRVGTGNCPRSERPSAGAARGYLGAKGCRGGGIFANSPDARDPRIRGRWEPVVPGAAEDGRRGSPQLVEGFPCIKAKSWGFPGTLEKRAQFAQ